MQSFVAGRGYVMQMTNIQPGLSARVLQSMKILGCISASDLDSLARSGVLQFCEGRVGFVGSMALGLVMGWVCVLVGRGTSGPLGVSWRALAFAGLALLSAAFLAFFYAGREGALTTVIAFGLGALTALIVLGTKAGPATGHKGG
jgi:hypothetical protein